MLRAVRFGAFEVDRQAREVRKRGLRLKLQEKPFQILEMLLERPGEVVTRQELRKRLWPETYVGFDRSLNTAINTLRRALGDSPENPRFVETYSRRGYRFIAPLDTAEVAAPPITQPLRSVAILPFENVGADPELEYLSDGITESIISSLSQLPSVRVMARSAVFRYKGQGVDPQAVGRDLRLHAVLTGRVVPRGDSLTIGAELVEVQNGWRLWGEVYTRSLSEIFAVQEDIAKEIASNLSLRLTGEEKRVFPKRHTGNVEAYREYLKGRYYCNKMNPDALRKSVGCFQQAIEKDPHYALAYAGLADAYNLFAFFGLRPAKEVMPLAKEAALEALQLDETVAEAHVTLGSIRDIYDWDWQAGEQEYRRALELNPSYPAGHHGYADHLAAVGRTQEGIREILQAQELDTLSLVYSMEIAWNWFMAPGIRPGSGAVLQNAGDGAALRSRPAYSRPSLRTDGQARGGHSRISKGTNRLGRESRPSRGNRPRLRERGAQARSDRETQRTKATHQGGVRSALLAGALAHRARREGRGV